MAQEMLQVQEIPVYMLTLINLFINTYMNVNVNVQKYIYV